MNTFGFNKSSSKSFATRDYVLNQNAVYGDCPPLTNKYVNKISSSVFAQNCEPKVFYNCPHPNNITSCYEANQTVSQNIQRGGVICDFVPRTEINTKIGSRFLSDPIKAPCDYVKDVETGFYLRHGESSSCSAYWKDRSNLHH